MLTGEWTRIHFSVCVRVRVCVSEGEFNHRRDIHTQVCDNLVHIQGTFYSSSAHRIKWLYSQSKVLSAETKMNFMCLLGLDIVEKLWHNPTQLEKWLNIDSIWYQQICLCYFVTNLWCQHFLNQKWIGKNILVRLMNWFLFVCPVTTLFSYSGL